MKYVAVIILIALCVGPMFAQSYVETHKAPYSRTLYGGASFIADSHYVYVGTGKWNKVTVKADTTAGTTTAWFCTNNDSTNAIPLRPGTGGAYGDGQTFLVRGLIWYRVKGAVPTTVTIE